MAHLGEVLLASWRGARAPNNQPPPASVFVLLYYFYSKTSTKVQVMDACQVTSAEQRTWITLHQNA